MIDRGREELATGIADPEAALLLCCANAAENLTAAELSTLSRKVDWGRVLRMASWHGLLPRLCGRLFGAPTELIPPEVKVRLREAFQESSRRSLIMTRELIRLLARFESEGVDALAYKGPALAMAAYGNLAMRAYADLDVLVRAQDVDRASGILAREGYRCQLYRSLTPVQERVARRFPCELLFVSEERRNQVDLHWDILPKMFAFPFDPGQLWARAERVPFGGGTVRTLSIEDFLLVLCVHNSKHRWERLGWICDVAGLIGRQAIDWNTVVTRAGEVGVMRMLLLGVLLADQVGGQATPPRIAERARGDTTVARLARRAIDQLFARGDAPTANVEDLRFYVKARERLRDKARFVARASLTPTINEVSLVSLPSSLAFLYYPLRPLRLAAKYSANHTRSILRRLS